MTNPNVLWASSFVVAFVTDGVSATGATVSTNVSVMLCELEPFTVTVIVDVPNLSASGLIVKVRDDPDPLNAMFATLFGTSAVLEEVALTDTIEAAPPTLKVN